MSLEHYKIAKLFFRRQKLLHVKNFWNKFRAKILSQQVKIQEKENSKISASVVSGYILEMFAASPKKKKSTKIFLVDE